MKKIVLDLKSGKVDYIEVPFPTIDENEIIIQSVLSILSVGTEKMLLNFGKSNPIQKIKSQPDKFKKLLEKIKTDGLLETSRAVKTKLDVPIALGYSNVGKVLESKSPYFKKGDLVVSNSSHSDINIANHSLVAKIPSNVSNENAVFTVLGSISMHGIRLAKPQIGEKVLVVGLGLIGLITCKLLQANGCYVIALDIDKERCKKASKMANLVINSTDNEFFYDLIQKNTNSKGVDKTIITAKSKDPNLMNKLIKSTMKNGTIIMIGDINLTFSRDELYKKEISFRVSSSYGPGRYDHLYENKNYDYPIEYVRWTANRNFNSILELLKNKKIDFNDLIEKKIIFDDLKEFYSSSKFNSSLGIVIQYNNEEINKTKLTNIEIVNDKLKEIVVGFLGTGSYANKFILPTIYKKNNTTLKTAVSKSGISASIASKKYKFFHHSSNYADVTDDNQINTVFIATQHNKHFEYVIKSIQNNKNIYIEKPLCISKTEFKKIEEEILKNNFQKKLFVGFNRRYSPIIKTIKKITDSMLGISNIVYTVNAGKLDQNHWINDPNVGGGRIISEVVHFLDLIVYLEDSLIKKFNVIKALGDKNNVIINLEMENNSIASINYITNGNNQYPKEKISIFKQEKIFEVNNFKSLKTYGLIKDINKKYWSQQKGNTECINYFLDSLMNDENIENHIDQYKNVHFTAFDIANETS